MDLGDVNVKKFGKEGDFLIKVEQKGDNNKLIPEIKKNLSDNLNSDVNFRRVENVGPKVSAELITIWYNCYFIVFSSNAFLYLGKI